LFSKVDSNKLQGYVKNETALICTKFGADLITSSKVTSHKTEWPSFFAPPCSRLGSVVGSVRTILIVVWLLNMSFESQNLKPIFSVYRATDNKVMCMYGLCLVAEEVSGGDWSWKLDSEVRRRHGRATG